ncbi:membrane-associating domain-containing protein, partial [Amylocarpus encephaloides]
LLLPLRVAQFVFSIVILGLSAYVAHWYDVDTLTSSPAQVNFLVFVPIFSFVSIIYLEVVPRFMQKASHPYVHFAFEALNTLFYFAGFVALAAFIGKLLFCRGSVCSAARADAVFAAFNWLLWTASTAIVALQIFKGGFKVMKDEKSSMSQRSDAVADSLSRTPAYIIRASNNLNPSSSFIHQPQPHNLCKNASHNNPPPPPATCGSSSTHPSCPPPSNPTPQPLPPPPIHHRLPHNSRPHLLLSPSHRQHLRLPQHNHRLLPPRHPRTHPRFRTPPRLLKSPMILIAGASMLLVFGMPYLMENMDPEMKAEFEERQKSSPLSGGPAANPLQNFDAAAWLAGSSGSGTSTPKRATGAEKEKGISR